MRKSQNNITSATYDTFTNEKGIVIYRCCLAIHNSKTHKAEQKTITARSRALLDARVELWTNEDSNDMYVPRLMKSPSVGRCVVAWQEDAAKKMSKETLYRYKISSRNYIIPRFGNLRIKRITPQLLQDYFDELSKDLSPKTLQMIRSHFSAFFETVVQMGVIEKNPVKATDSPARSNKKNMREDDLVRLLTVAKSGKYLPPQSDLDFEEFLRKRNYLIVLIGAATGLKKEDVVGLTWQCIQGNKIVLPDTKDSVRQTANLPDDVASEIKEWRKFQENFANKKRRRPYVNTAGLVFTKLNGEEMTAHWFNRLVFRKMCVAAGISTPKRGVERKNSQRKRRKTASLLFGTTFRKCSFPFLVATTRENTMQKGKYPWDFYWNRLCLIRRRSRKKISKKAFPLRRGHSALPMN